jgi:hypothetical protein
VRSSLKKTSKRVTNKLRSDRCNEWLCAVGTLLLKLSDAFRGLPAQHVLLRLWVVSGYIPSYCFCWQPSVFPVRCQQKETQGSALLPCVMTSMAGSSSGYIILTPPGTVPFPVGLLLQALPCWRQSRWIALRVPEQ